MTLKSLANFLYNNYALSKDTNLPMLINKSIISIYFCSLDYHCGDFSPTNLNAYLKLFPYGKLLEMELLGKGI